ncbi:phage tail tape measure protein [Salipaludibacillus sp. HK11]|uniref:phage tail tape measure protein n=1 Tax=Salipaludibacillus sp. HK11 TaxID=3394320 RepID=UPI0039FC76AA
MSQQYSIVANIIAKTGEFTKAMNDASQKTNSFAKDFATKTQNIGQGMMNVGSKLTKSVSLPLVGLGVVAVKTFADFDDSMRKTQALLGDNLGGTVKEQEKNLQMLTDEAKRMGSTTAHSASSAADAMGYMALAGWDTTQIMAGIEPVLNLASASGMDLATTSDIVTDSMSMFGMKAEEAGRMADALASASSKSNTDVTQLGEALKYVGANASASGMDIEQTSAFLGILADNGLKGSVAGTTLNSVLRDMKKNAEGGAISFGDQSVAIYDSNGNMRDMTTVMSEVIDATSHLSDEQRDFALSQIFGAEAMKGMNILLGEGSDAVGDLEEQLRNSEGTAKTMAEILEGGLGGAFRGLKSAMEAVFIAFGETLKPFFIAITDYVADVARKFADLDDGTKKLIVIFGGVIAIIPPLIFGFGLIVKSLGIIMGVLATVNAPFIILIGLIGGLVFAFKDQLWGVLQKAGEWFQPLLDAFKYLTGGFDKSIEDARFYGTTIEDLIGSKAMRIVELFNEMKSKVLEVWNQLKDIIVPIVENIKTNVVQFLDQLKQKWQENGEQIVGRITETYNAIMDIIRPVLADMISFIQETLLKINQFWDENGAQILDAVTNAFNGIMTVINFVMPFIGFIIETVWNSIKGVIDGTLTFIMGIVKVFSGLLTGDFSKMWEGIKDMFFGAIKAIWHFMELNFMGRIVMLVKNLVKLVVNLIKSKWTSITQLFKSGGEVASKIIDTLRSSISKIWNSIKDFIVRVATDIWNSIKSRFDSIFKTVSSITTNIRTTISNIWNTIRTTITNVVTGILNSVRNNFNNILSSARSIFSSIRTAMTNPIQTARTIISGIVDRIKGFFTSMKLKFPSLDMKFITSARDTISTAINRIKGFFSNLRLKFPSISMPKLPKFTMTGSFGLKPPSVPKLGISWNKMGGIFNTPTIFNTANAGLQGVGEAGAEAILPLTKSVLGTIGDKIFANISGKTGVVNNHEVNFNNEYTFNVDGDMSDQDMKKIANYVAKQQLSGLKKLGK